MTRVEMRCDFCEMKFHAFTKQAAREEKEDHEKTEHQYESDPQI